MHITQLFKNNTVYLSIFLSNSCLSQSYTIGQLGDFLLQVVINREATDYNTERKRWEFPTLNEKSMSHSFLLCFRDSHKRDEERL